MSGNLFHNLNESPNQTAGPIVVFQDATTGLGAIGGSG
jgi:hypothetical protein